MPKMENGTKITGILDKFSRPQFIFLIALITIPLCYFIFNPQPSLIDDNFHYMNLAQQLYSGEGYTSPYSIEAIPETHVAPGFPFILSLIMRFAGNGKPIIALKLFNNICYLLAIIFLALVFDKHLKVNRWVSFFFSIFMVFNVEISRYASMVTTEAPFLLFSILTIFLFLEYAQEKKFLYFLFASLSTVAALYIRIPGAPLAVISFIWLIWRKDYKKAVLYAVIVGALVGIWVFPLLFSGEFRYMSQLGRGGLDTSKYGRFGSFTSRYFHHLFSYIFKYIPSLFIPHHLVFLHRGSEISIFSWLGLILGIPFTAFTVWGTVRTFRDKKNNLVTLYAVLYYLIYSVFGSHGTRYASYAFPFIFYIAILGFWAFLEWAKLKRAWRLVIATVLLGLMVFLEGFPAFLSDTKLTSVTRAYYKQHGSEYTELGQLYRYKQELSVLKMHKAFRWCAKNLPEGDVILASQYRTAHFLTDHHVVVPLHVQKYFKVGFRGFIADKSIAEIDSLGEWVLDNKATYIVFDPIYNISSYFIAPMMSRYQECFEEIYRTEQPKTMIFSVDTTCLRSSISKGNQKYVDYYKSLYKAKVAKKEKQIDSLLALRVNIDEESEIANICRTHSYLIDMKNQEEAQMFFEGALVLFPDDPDLWMNRGIDLNQAGMNDMSIIALEKAKALGADEADCYNNIATAYANLKDYDNSRENFEMAAKLEPNDPLIFRNLFSVMVYQGDLQSAEKLINEQLARTDVDSSFVEQIRAMQTQYQNWKANKPTR
ncbi:glycosyltransferase family 39 protein [bacterium]|nr:glycosyltransferase family 39 protein [bacterium]